MSLRYKNLNELRNAYTAGEVIKPVWVDNDRVDAYVGDDDEADEEGVLVAAGADMGVADEAFLGDV